jgi:hypothetical protein
MLFRTQLVTGLQSHSYVAMGNTYANEIDDKQSSMAWSGFMTMQQQVLIFPSYPAVLAVAEPRYRYAMQYTRQLTPLLCSFPNDKMW